ncbi:agouti-related protein [Lampris incognitus]|uniref:agouti-related protein n=1 Tax=Lampris incognitus TaxID=2546036 RepID=UPI0024B50B35|nr:agouti-related protein [Lampris incognitus]
MLSSLVVCWWALSLLRVSSGLVHGKVHLDDSEPILRRTESSFLSDKDTNQRSRPDSALLAVDSMEDQLIMAAESYDEEVSEALQLKTRAMRSPRRCIPHQQSCLGHQLSCCDPCDTCYCRFFNAICYCRRIGQPCSHRRT